MAAIAASRELSQALSAISSGVFAHDDPHRYTDLVAGLQSHDWFMVAADFDSYASVQREIDTVWIDKAAWFRKAIHNTANMGWFSSDRTISEYAREIWGVK